MIIWIASYPKSGNTWVRYFLKSYFEPTDQKLTLKTTKEDNFYSLYFPNLSLLKELNVEYMSFVNIVKNWVPMQDFVNLNGKINYFKTHNAMCTINNYPFTNKENTLGGIYLVRDPRDVLISYSNHLGLNHKETLERMFDSNNGEYQTGDNYSSAITGTWSDHYNSWKTYNSRKILIIKYEDLISDTLNTFSKIVNYLSEITEIKFDKDKIKYSIKKTSFESLSQLEKEEGFEEKGKGKSFFRKGKIGSWKDELCKELSREIEFKFKKEMSELNYI